MGHFEKNEGKLQSSNLRLAIIALLFALGSTPRLVIAQQASSATPGKKQATQDPQAQEDKTENRQTKQGASRENELGLRTIKNIVRDQRQIWTSPVHVRLGHADWLVPYAGLTAGFLVTDRDASLHLSNSPSTLQHYRDFSNYGLAGMGSAVGGLYLWGKATGDAHKQEASILSGEAAANALVVAEILKYATGRERPTVDAAHGKFWQGGDSFPSGHAALSWAAASVISHEYPGPFTKLLAYGAAAAISISRVEGKRHFPSDAFVGSGIGWLAGWQVYRAHHNPEVGGGGAEDLSDSPKVATDRTPSAMGSPYVPLDSWIYPLLDRLAALGLYNDATHGMKPWTRLECARLVSEAGDRLQDSGAETEGARLYDSLRLELSSELSLLGGGTNNSAHLESIYARATQISGPPLTDGFHFGQTLINDFGRPFERGFNSVDGFSGWATAGRWVAYARAEYQHSPLAPALPLAARQTIATVDGIPVVPPAAPFAAVNRMRFLDVYVGLNFENWQVSFGKQSLWWGPGDGGPMMFSNEAEPINMFRIDRVSPFQPPGLLKFLGPVRMQIFVGQLAGHHFVDTPSGITGSWSQPLNPQPLISGEKFNFKISPNLELGLGYMTIFGGVGVPATPSTFAQSFLDLGGDLPDGTSKSSRETMLDFSYRIPKLRKWLTLYGEGFAHDQIIYFIDPKARPLPFGYPDRAAWQAGIYVPRFPRLRELDFRAEGGYTNNPLGPRGGYSQGFYYNANRHLNGDTNDGHLLGSWLGRAGQGVQAWTNYWLGARNRVQLNFRHLNVGQRYLPGGGSLTDVGVRGDYWLGPFGFSAWVQRERWLFPVIQPNVSRNVTATLQVSFEPQRLSKHFAGSAMETAGIRDQR